ncbi:MAG: amylo-alpha-1,6-glucosidase [Victivallaceae bacterium]|nr:amylo-alpha-1,6-glucosidase [Victivallaceae bacterium]
MNQTLSPSRRIFFRGDAVRITLDTGNAEVKKAFFRTTFNRRAYLDEAAIERHEKNLPGDAKAAAAWQDLPMHRVEGSANRFERMVPLLECGVFEGKCFAVSQDDAILWPSSDNLRIKVEPAMNIAGNTVYCAFVRQFGGKIALPNAAAAVSPETVASAEALERGGYTVIPPSGTFRNLIGRLDHIFNDLNCRILQLLPIHPTPTVYGRMGRFGSPFAPLDYFAVSPELADFDPSATALEQFLELVSAVHARGGRIFLDIPVNHTGWASKLQERHPEYFVRGSDGKFTSPGAWGIVWADLCQLNFNCKGVAETIAKVFLYWCAQGVDGFRCDAGYMVPSEAWSYIVARVKREFPDTVFLLEGLGGPAKVQENLLGQIGLSWGYSELFQNESPDEIAGYLGYAGYVSSQFGTLINFAETHDNNRLAARGRLYASMRCALTALFSSGAGFGFANGVEFYASEKIDVHRAGGLNWGNPDNQVKFLGMLDTLLANHPALGAASVMELCERRSGDIPAAVRRSSDGKDTLWVAVNTDCRNHREAAFPERAIDPDLPLYDLISGKMIAMRQENGKRFVNLPPGGCVALTADEKAVGIYRELAAAAVKGEPAASVRQRAQSAALALMELFAAERDSFDPAAEAKKLLAAPETYLETLTRSPVTAVTVWHGPRDCRRLVPIPDRDLLMIQSENPFRYLIRRGLKVAASGMSLPSADGTTHFAYADFRSLEPGRLEMRFVSFENTHGKCFQGQLLMLPPAEKLEFSPVFDVGTLHRIDHVTLGVNLHGSYTMARAAFGTIESKYDAILAVNPDLQRPADRYVMAGRVRAWAVVNDFSTELNFAVLKSFVTAGDGGEWRFEIPTGQGRGIPINVRLVMDAKENRVRMSFTRCGAESAELPLKLIVRPTVDDRINHTVTKAYAGAETHFPASIRAGKNNFVFAPSSERILQVAISGAGVFHQNGEWSYQQELPVEAYYGLEHTTDLFSPGYFETPLECAATSVLCFAVNCPCTETVPEAISVKPIAFRRALEGAMEAYLVRREDNGSVIAGYPWFLDWGRDTLIALRGVIAAGKLDFARAAIVEFASFEDRGTIPNMIRGADSSNRETSDAPLWLFTAVADYIAKSGSEEILEVKCPDRSLEEVLLSILHFYREGTANGICCDKEANLVWSPPHYTWMDTNYPAGTPRCGYPVEIQALWYAAQKLLAKRHLEYQTLAATTARSLEHYFYLPKKQRFSDCLHVEDGRYHPASEAVADDHVRSNQLLLVTLGAVSDPARIGDVIRSAGELVLPGAIRSLADRDVEYRLPVELHGRLLNNPGHPYVGFYRGPEDTERKAAYHNGTGWGWMFPSYCEALYLAGGSAHRARALSLLGSVRSFFEGNVPGQLPEICDGDYPHSAGGCPAQAWSVTEAYRVWELLS